MVDATTYPDPTPSRTSAPVGLRSLHRLHWLIVILSLIVTASAWSISRQLMEHRIESRFDREVTGLVNRVKERLSRYDDALRAGKASIVARDGQIDRVSWQRFAGTLDVRSHYRGVNGIGLISIESRATLGPMIDRERMSLPDFDVYPVRDADLYMPIVYIEPQGINHKAVGLDMAHEPRRRAAAISARLTGRTRMTAPVVLVADANESPGFLLFTPWYRSGKRDVAYGGGTVADIRQLTAAQLGSGGLVYSPFTVSTFMADVLANTRRQFTVTVSDTDETLFDENDSGTPGHDPEPLRSTTVDIPLYGRTWQLDIRSNLAFRDALGMQQPKLVLIGGLTFNMMLVGLFVGMSRTRRAVEQVARMNADLQHKARALADTNQDLESFACVVSHDLKTPLRGMGDLAWYLEEDLEPYLSSASANPDVRHNIGRLHSQVDRMNALIDGILEYSAAREESISIERIDSRRIFEEIAETLELAPGQLCLPAEMPVFEGCVTRFMQVFSNIVGNAFKYHPDRTNAAVRVSTESRGSLIRFSIADNGPGIDARYHEKIFEMFQTLQPNDAIESTGVGLSIVRRATTRVGGAVSVESDAGAGSTFHVDWPRVMRHVKAGNSTSDTNNQKAA